MEEQLELRMYGLIPYQLSNTIHAGIQYGHSVVEYALKYSDTNLYQDWAKNYKTFIILNGGTTNLSDTFPGTLNQNLEIIKTLNIPYSIFNEPDLGDQLTAITFIVDERVFNKKKYPDFREYLEYTAYSPVGVKRDIKKHCKKKPLVEPKIELIFNDEYKEWVNKIGGETNVKLRDFLKNFRLA